MGLLYDKRALFEGRAPNLSIIAAKAQELSGLAVRCGEPATDEPPGLYDINGVIAFECAHRNTIGLCVYDVATVLASDELRFHVGSVPPFPQDVAEWLAEPPGKQAMHVQILVTGFAPLLPEHTLETYVLLALEALGGEVQQPPDAKWRHLCAAPITEFELKRRQWLAMGTTLLQMPLAIPAGCMSIIRKVLKSASLRPASSCRMKQSDVQPPPPHRLERGKRVRYALVRTTIFSLNVISWLFTTLWVIVGIPLSFLLVTVYLLVRFAGATAVLTYHMLSKRRLG